MTGFSPDDPTNVELYTCSTLSCACFAHFMAIEAALSALSESTGGRPSPTRIAWPSCLMRSSARLLPHRRSSRVPVRTATAVGKRSFDFSRCS